MKPTLRLIPVLFVLVSTFGITAQGSAAETSSSNTSTGSNTSSLSPGESNVIGKTADTYSAFAGSRSNAENLATGLRQGGEVTLTGTADAGTTNTTFIPPTKPMGHGNVDKAMALSSQQLANAGVAQPTGDQIKSSMMGGTITNDAGESVELQGVLQMRAEGMGWGKIAHELGVKPGQGYKPAHTDSGVTTASGASSSVATASKSGKTQPESTAKQSKSSSMSTQNSGIVSASGAGPGQAKSVDKSGGQRATGVSNSSAGHSGVTNASGHGHGVVNSGSGSVSRGNDASGGMSKGHLK